MLSLADRSDVSMGRGVAGVDGSVCGLLVGRERAVSGGVASVERSDLRDLIGPETGGLGGCAGPDRLCGALTGGA